MKLYSESSSAGKSPRGEHFGLISSLQGKEEKKKKKRHSKTADMKEANNLGEEFSLEWN